MLVTPEMSELIDDSVTVLRRVRASGLSAAARNPDHPAPAVEPQFRDARRLGEAFATVCMDYFDYPGTEDKGPVREIIEDLSERYVTSPTLSRLFLYDLGEVLRHYPIRFESPDPVNVQFHLQRKNQIGFVDQLYFRQPERLGIFAPLSGDYLTALFVARYYERIYGKRIDVEPVVMDTHGGSVVFPVDSSGRRVFEQKEALTFFIDGHDSNTTRDGLINAMQKEYSDKDILS